MAMACPSDEAECYRLLSSAYAQSGPVAVRYPRGAGVGAALPQDLQPLPLGKGVVRRQGRRLAILAFGTLLHPALAAAEALDATVVDMRWAKPLDLDLLRQVARQHEALVTVEEGALAGGAGAAVLEALQAEQLELPVLSLGLPDLFIEHGDPAVLLSRLGLDAPGIERQIRERFLSGTNTVHALKIVGARCDGVK
jgi:1-deoxy-D-xylulose-5-phosphate synthase